MFCLTLARKIPDGAIRPQRLSQTDPSPIELVGTMDFKWPRRSVIRVAFEAPEPGFEGWVFDAARAKIIELAALWRTTVIDGDRAPRAGSVPLTLKFLDRPFSKAPLTEYEVLISLKPLPITLRPQLPGDKQDVIFAPRSQLGTYAKRVDYGVPTSYLGAPPGTVADSVLAYYDSEEGQHLVLHELGHILGLGHGHQNPLLKNAPRWKSVEHCVNVLKALLGTRLAVLKDKEGELSEYVERQIRNPWRYSPGFSQWPQIDDVDEASVMIYPSYRCMLQGVQMDCSLDNCGCIRYNGAPSEGDVAWLTSQYARPQPVQPSRTPSAPSPGARVAVKESRVSGPK